MKREFMLNSELARKIGNTTKQKIAQNFLAVFSPLWPYMAHWFHEFKKLYRINYENSYLQIWNKTQTILEELKTSEMFKINFQLEGQKSSNDYCMSTITGISKSGQATK